MTITRFDHAVLVANEEARARRFYTERLNASVAKTFERERGGKTVHRSFLNVGDDGHVVALFEDKVTVPEPKAIREFPCVVFLLGAADYAKAIEGLEGVEVSFPITGIESTFYTHDSEGNPIGFTRGPVGGPPLLRLEFDTPDLAAACRFYEGPFGLVLSEKGTLSDGSPYAWFGTGDVGQGLLLVEHAGAPSEYLGHHFAFYVDADEHLGLKENLSKLGIEEAEGHEGDRVEGEIGTYVIDPWGRKMQWITHAPGETGHNH